MEEKKKEYNKRYREKQKLKLEKLKDLEDNDKFEKKLKNMKNEEKYEESDEENIESYIDKRIKEGMNNNKTESKSGPSTTFRSGYFDFFFSYGKYAIVPLASLCGQLLKRYMQSSTPAKTAGSLYHSDIL